MMSRLNSAAGRVFGAPSGSISAVTSRPMKCYIPKTSPTATMPGAPAFSLDGNIVGIFVTRSISLKGGGDRNMRNSMVPIILPADDILKAAKQVPEAKADTSQKAGAQETKQPK